MNKLISYIEPLLTRSECVVIPTWGALLCQELPARHTEESQTLHPRRERIHFNADLCERDGLLDAAYARDYGVSIRRAKLMVDKDVEQLRAQLAQTGTISFGMLGSFCLSEGDCLEFFPSETIKQLGSGDAYGLIPLRWQAGTQPLSSFVQSADESYYHIRLPKRAVQWAAAVFITFLFLLPTTYHSTGRHYSAGFSGQIPAENEVITPTKNLGLPTTQAIDEQSLSPSVQPEVNEHATGQKTSTYGDYYVIVASFQTEAKAQKFIALEEENFSAGQLGMLTKGKKIYVYAARSATQAMARDEQCLISKQGGEYRQCWILHHPTAPY